MVVGSPVKFESDELTSTVSCYNVFLINLNYVFTDWKKCYKKIGLYNAGKSFSFQ